MRSSNTSEPATHKPSRTRAAKKSGNPVRHSKQRRTRDSEKASPRRRLLSRLAVGLQAVIACVLVLMPAVAGWDFGGVLPWTQWLLASTLLMLAVPVGMLVVLQSPIARRRMSLAIPLVLLAVGGIGALQGLPLPTALVRSVAPDATQAYQDWLPEQLRSEVLTLQMPAFEPLAAGNNFISISPWHSRQAMGNFAVFAATLLFSAVVFRRKWALLTAFAVTATTGSLLAFLSTLHYQTPLAIASSVPDERSFGPFINGNNAACYLNLTLAFAIGWLTYLLTKQTDRNVPDARYRSQVGTPWEKLLQVIQLRLRHLRASTAIVFVLCVVIFVGVISTNSRGGLLGTLVGAAVVVALGLCEVFRTRLLQTTVWTGGLVFALGLLWILSQSGVGLDDSINQDRSVSTRLDHWSDASQAAWNFLPLGAGVGTYRFAYLPFQKRGEAEWFLNADNLVVEWFVEGGVWELLLLLIAVAVLVMMLLKLNDVRHAPHLTALVVAGSFMLASQAASQILDFGLLLPANYLLVAVLCGAVIGYHDQISRRGKSLSVGRLRTSTVGHSKAGKPIRTGALVSRLSSTRTAFASLCFGAVVGLIFAAGQLGGAAHNDHWIRRAKLVQAKAKWGADMDALAASNSMVLNGLDETSFDPAVHVELAKCWILESRLAAIRNATNSGMSGKQAWEVSSPAVLRAVLFDPRGAALRQNLAGELSAEQYQALRNARTYAVIALLLCPLNPEVRAVLVDLDFMAEDPTSSGQLLSQLAELRPRASTAGDWAIKKAFINPGGEAAAAICRQHLARYPDRLSTIWPWVAKQNDVDFALRCLPDQIPVLLTAAESSAHGSELRAAVTQHAERWLAKPTTDATSNTDAYRGRLAEINEQLELAAKFYASAVEHNPADHRLRFRLVTVLEQQGRFSEAADQLHRCLLQSPNNAVYRAKADVLRDHP